jgi:hypothetical protein
MSRAEEEQIKLTANWLNIVAAGTVVTGAVAPLIAYAIGTIPNGVASPHIVGVGSAVSPLLSGSGYTCSRVAA